MLAVIVKVASSGKTVAWISDIPSSRILPTRESMRLKGCLKFRVHIEEKTAGYTTTVLFLPSKGPFSLLGVNVNDKRENYPL